MSDVFQSRVLALAGLLQSLKQVRQIAETGQANTAVLETAIDSVFRIDAESPEAVYGDAQALRPGLLLLRQYFQNDSDDVFLPKLALALTQLERKFVRDHEMVRRVRSRIASLASTAHNVGGTHPDVLSGLGKLYEDTISGLRPRVIVQGNPHYLGQAAIVAEIRAVLLAALRSAVLWRQMGGTLWDFVFRRKNMVESIDALLA